ncbi:MAG: ThuA domain-containing protein, partial [Mariniphaga sp.]|nr:ThuA domain-containing protein [Mariniphaga sp.]
FIFCFIIGIVYAKPVKVLVITGGHSYDTLSFKTMFEEMGDFDFDYLNQPEANIFISNGNALEYDLLVFYDMWRTISEKEKQGYIKLTEKGMPLLFLHHSIVSYQDWPDFEKLIGGKYVENNKEAKENQSTYRHDVWIDVLVVDSNHPITKAMSNFRLFDEVYGNFRVSEDVIPLLKTNHPESTKIIGWENSFNFSKIVYLQPGHDYNTFKSKEFRKLIVQAIHYLVGSD